MPDQVCRLGGFCGGAAAKVPSVPSQHDLMRMNGFGVVDAMSSEAVCDRCCSHPHVNFSIHKRQFELPHGQGSLPTCILPIFPAYMHSPNMALHSLAAAVMHQCSCTLASATQHSIFHPYHRHFARQLWMCSWLCNGRCMEGLFQE